MRSSVLRRAPTSPGVVVALRGCAVVTSLILLLCVGCPGPPCALDRDCEPGHYCALAEDQNQGNCAQDCNEFWTCPQGSLCAVNGQCQLEARAPQLVVTEPRGAVEGQPGDTFRVAGYVAFLGSSAELTVSIINHGGCEPSPPTSVEISGDRSRELKVPFALPSVTMPSGGGLLKVEVHQDSYHTSVTRELNSPDRCPGCPQLELTEPTSGELEPRVFFTQLFGSVSDLDNGTARWTVESQLGNFLSAPLHPGSTGQFGSQLVPLDLGRNWISIQATNSAGTSTCRRYLQTSTANQDRLLVSLGWSSGVTDLDLHLVPPAGSYGPSDCSAAVSEETRFSGCTVLGDAQAFGPETVVIPADGPSGTYGILVVGFFGPQQAVVPAYVSVQASGGDHGMGGQLAMVGPRDMTATRSEIWVVGTVHLPEGDGTPSFTSIDEMIDFAPTRSPEDWPPY